MKRKMSWSFVVAILLAISLSGCSWGSGFTIVLPDREIEVSIPKTGVNFPKVELDLFDGDRVDGSEDFITVERDVQNFDQVTIMGSGEVIITFGEEESLMVTIEDNMLKYLETKVEAGTLSLGWDPDKARDKDLRPSRAVRFEIVAKELSRLSLYGSAHVEIDEHTSRNFVIDLFGKGDVFVGELLSDRVSVHLLGMGYIEIESLIADKLKVELPGIGDIVVAGEVEEQDVDIPGTGDYEAKDLLSEVAYVSIKGSGDATLWVTEYLEGEVLGIGRLSYYGDPATSFHRIGAGSIKNLGNR